ncbi:MAG TPA: phage holin family protein [Candidatus Saccharimonadales bacterium]|nr:phage holin family protein [Candidatus Saccharimonadales bacterium]
MNILISWVLSAVVIMVSAYLLPGVHVSSFLAALVTAVVLGIINAIIKPVLLLLTLPINIVTLGLFTFVINALLILLTSSIVPGFKVDGFLWALIFGIVLSLLNSFINQFNS